MSFLRLELRDFLESAAPLPVRRVIAHKGGWVDACCILHVPDDRHDRSDTFRDARYDRGVPFLGKHVF